MIPNNLFFHDSCLPTHVSFLQWDNSKIFFNYSKHFQIFFSNLIQSLSLKLIFFINIIFKQIHLFQLFYFLFVYDIIFINQYSQKKFLNKFFQKNTPLKLFMFFQITTILSNFKNMTVFCLKSSESRPCKKFLITVRVRFS